MVRARSEPVVLGSWIAGRGLAGQLLPLLRLALRAKLSRPWRRKRDSRVVRLLARCPSDLLGVVPGLSDDLFCFGPRFGDDHVSLLLGEL